MTGQLPPTGRAPAVWRARLVKIAAFAAVLSASACASQGEVVPELGVTDATPAFSRKVHAFNKGFDRRALRPLSARYDRATPKPARALIRNALSHLETPRDLANHVLSGRIAAAGRTLARFAVNTALGGGGLVDPASELGLTNEPADFGQTLYTLGAGEGVYYEAPFLGPTTIRHTVGRSIDFLLNPTMTLSIIEFRAANAAVIDQLLYDSPDSYAASRAAYLQNRRFYLKGDEDGAAPGAVDLFDAEE